jgi:phospholipid/cholesterol/gamma-HCH transport system substrate-binding protein
MKKTRLQQTSMEVTVGAFMMMVLLALGFFTIVLSRENIFLRNYPLEVAFDDVTGLIEGDKVYVHGVDVGRVRSMELREGRVFVMLSLRYEPSLHEDYAISVQPASVLGGKFVEIREGTRALPVLPAGTVVVGQAPVDFIEETSEAVRTVRTSLEEGGVLKNLEGTMANMKEITEGLRSGEGTIGKLFKDDALYAELTEVTRSLRSIAEKLSSSEGSAGKLINDSELYDNLNGLAADLRKVSERLERGEGTLGRLLSQDDQLYNDVSEAVASIKDFSKSLNTSEGTIGKLVRDDALYEDLKSLIAEVRAAVDDIRETSPVATFSGVMFGAF